ncbi:thiamine biosynthesis protein ThiF [Pelagerythrobacter aerophilus]|uniref:Thiamine biosynthesis protein ThiF n=1 Tax=Pelagerythrobacter aerophilus TaxID=2306995 RepID=A0A418NKZ1_9SPHN|nr:thiamine biosynthesis protein ThiF [Pelagerythrobacter aerophilus]RIV80351.1 thiamine biosynthesis protein ThiF [Pelagerythrobacter aerophilus]
MPFIDTAKIGDQLHRLAKLTLDTGEATTIEEAMQLLERYSLHVDVDPRTMESAAGQAALATTVNAARRAFLGGVTVSGVPDVALRVPLYGQIQLKDLVEQLGGRCVDAVRPAASHMAIGRRAMGLRATMDGWVAGCYAEGADFADSPEEAFVLTGIAAAGLTVAECFQQVRKSNPAAGRRRIALSLWRPDLPADDPRARGESPSVLPSSAWLIGLGNLGQAYLWALGWLPYADPSDFSLTLQDFDKLAESNDSTSLLTDLSMVGRCKSRAMAEWAEARGFATTIVERRFDRELKVNAEDPPVALCGVDNALARSALEDAGFGRVFEAGLGNGVSDYLALRLHSFPGPKAARQLWSGEGAAEPELLDRPAYRDLEERGADRCGLVQLAGRTVGAPFVGALAGALVVAELVKLANGGPNTALLDLHLRSPGQLAAFAQTSNFAFNPGGLLIRRQGIRS